MTRIDVMSRANPRLKRLLAEREERFFFAGDKLVRDCLARPLRVETLLVRSDMDATLPTPRAEVGEEWRVSAAVMARAAGMQSPPALLAVLDIPEARIDFSRCRLTVALVGVQDPGNLGTAFRCASAFAVPALALAGAGARPNHAKVVRAAQTALLDVPFQVFRDPGRLVDAALAAGARVYATGSRPGGGALALERVEFPCLLLLGGEGQGLDPRLLERFPRVRLDQEERIDSLNVGISACILMHELRRLHGT
jgi:TrmH family RNA methyltransferase